jgi:adenylate cyclase
MQQCSVSVHRARYSGARPVAFCAGNAHCPDPAQSSIISDMRMLEELNRRGVVRAAAMYVAIAWGGTEILVFLVEALWGDTAAEPARKYLAVAFVAGFPVAMYLAWTRDLGMQARRLFAAGALATVLVAALIWFVPDGARRTEDAAGQGVALNPKSIAVLPFENMSGDRENVYFSHGISEELLNVLARIPNLKVSSQTSSFYFAGKDVPLKDIATQLGVRHILEGSVRRVGNQVRIAVQLVDTDSDMQIWSETYDREVLDMFAVQEEIAGMITARLQVMLAGTGKSRRPTNSEQAYDRYLRGLHLIVQDFPNRTYLAARDHLQAAIDLDPGFAEARAQLAVTLIGLGNFRVMSPTTAFPQAFEAANAALALDPGLAEAHLALGWVALSYQRDWRLAEQEFRAAIELAPNNAFHHLGLMWPLQITGRYDQALEAAKRAFDLDPLSIWTRNSLSSLFHKRRDLEKHLQMELTVLEMTPENPAQQGWVGLVYAELQQPQLALPYLHAALERSGGEPNTELIVATAYAFLGNDQDARTILQKAERARESRFVSPGFLAAVYANLGESDTAMTRLEEAVAAYDSWVWNLDEPYFDPLRPDPRFMALCQRLGMACASARVARSSD